MIYLNTKNTKIPTLSETFLRGEEGAAVAKKRPAVFH